MSEQTAHPQVPKFALSELSHIKHVIGIVSGKGGVGKSFVTGALATEMAKRGKTVGILDADITGPSIPQMFGVHEKLQTVGHLLLPSISSCGIKVMSANLLLDDETQPVLWRGPILAGAIQQFWSETSWGDIDYLFVDMPPGTGDVALTVFQSLPIQGVVIVTSPQDLVSMIVGKAVHMAQKMDVEILGLVENMSYAVCPQCDEHIEIFGHSKLEAVAKEYHVDALDSLPIDPNLSAACDAGDIFDKLPDAFLPKTCAKIDMLEELVLPSQQQDAPQTQTHAGCSERAIEFVEDDE